MIKKCTLCPIKCGIDRTKQAGRCKSTDKIKIALYSVHDFEEPCISGEKGSGTIFFSNCNMKCIYCQNYEISQQGKGKEITIEELAEIFIKQQENDVENINLVTPTTYVPQIIEAIKIARKNGLKIPIVYNTNGYEKVETLKMLEGYIDIYLPDLKYSDDLLAKRLSKVDNYFEIATDAIKEMHRQVGNTSFNENGIMNIVYNNPFKGGGITQYIYGKTDIDVVQIEINRKYRDLNNPDNIKMVCYALIKFFRMYTNFIDKLD